MPVFFIKILLLLIHHISYELKEYEKAIISTQTKINNFFREIHV